MKLLRCFIFFLLSIQPAMARKVKVGIAVDVTSCTFISAFSSYRVINSTGDTLLELNEGESAFISVGAEEIVLRKGTTEKRSGNTVFFRSSDTAAFFRFKYGAQAYPYDDELQVIRNGKKLSAINMVEKEKYVAGVVESEAGNNNNPEFLKVQSILVRTFLESHADRHRSQGFSVCDKVHCQVYHARSRFNKQIAAATEATRGMVITEANGALIKSVYHSNCGGQTMNAEALWAKEVSYLQSVRDSFCVRNGSRGWEKLIDRKDWRKYLGSKFNCLIYDDVPDSAYQFDQQVRKNYLLFEGNLLALKTIRNDWKLNSTFFEIIPQGDKILIRGKGYGHGVGLCQEGAMQMAASGFTVEQIIGFYFKGARISKR